MERSFGPTLGLGRRTLLIVAAACLSVVMLASASQAKAGSENFCLNYNAAPFGQPGDRCAAGTFRYAIAITVQGWEHSVCANALNTSGNLIWSWQCTPGPNTYVTIYPGQRYVRGIGRNNTTGAWTHLSGGQTW
jgi:hypothetical protein